MVFWFVLWRVEDLRWFVFAIWAWKNRVTDNWWPVCLDSIERSAVFGFCDRCLLEGGVGSCLMWLGLEESRL